jgi:Fibronectin type III domain
VGGILGVVVLALVSLLPAAQPTPGTPGPPTGVTARAGVGSAEIKWTAPASSGTSPITGYEVVSSRGQSFTSLGTVTMLLMTGLDPFAQTFTVAAFNASGTGPASAPSAEVVPSFGGTYHPLTPTRILDTRTGRGPLGPGQQLFLDVAGLGGLPTSGISAVVLNVTATNTTASSFLTLWEARQVQPATSSLNWSAGQTVPNLVDVGLLGTTTVAAFNLQGSVDLVCDLEGWFGDATNSTGPAGMFNLLRPARLLDTRNGHVPLGPGESRDLQVAGNGGVPPGGVSAVVMNVTVTNPTASSFLTVWPAGAARPLTSNLNFVAGQTVPNRVIATLGAGGRVSIFNPAGSVDIVVDVGGWFTDSSNHGGGSALFSYPVRVYDSRVYRSPLGPLEPRIVDYNISITTALVLNVTGTEGTAATFLTLWPDRTPRPPTSDLNPAAGQTVANLAVVGVTPDLSNPLLMEFDVFNDNGYQHVVIDEEGHFGPVMQPLTGAPVGLAKR